MADAGKISVKIGAESGELKRGLDSASQQLKNFGTSVGSIMKKLAVAFAAVFAVSKVIDFGKASVKAANDMAIQEAKLATILKQRMHATDGTVQSVKDLISAQEALGVVDVVAQTAGAQELATYLTSTASLKELIPTLNDLVAQQYGVSASAEQVVNMAALLGKTMDGQIGSLQRYGFTFDDAQKKILEYGNETQRVALLTEVIKDSIGNMNAELGKTPQGQMKQLRYTMDAIQMSIGNGLMSAIQRVMPYLVSMANVILKAAQYFQMLMAAIFGTAKMSTAATGAALGLADSETAAGDAAEEAGKKAKSSVASFDEVNTLSDPTGGKGGGGGGALDIQSPEVDTETVPTKIQEMVDRVKLLLSTMWDGTVEGATNYAIKLREAFAGIGDSFQPFIDAKEPIKTAFLEIGQTAMNHVNNFLKPVAEYITLDFIPSIVKGLTESFAPVFASTLVWAMQLFSTTFKNITTTMQGLWESTWLPSVEKVKNAYLEAFPLMAVAVQTLLDGTLKPFVDYALNGFVIPIAAKIQQTLVPLFTDVLVFAIKEYTKSFQWSADTINSVYKTVIEPTFNLIKKIVTDVLTNLENLWEKHGASILVNVSGIFDGIRAIFETLWNEILEPIIRPFLETLDTLWEESFKGMIEQGTNFTTNLINSALEILNKFIIPLIGYLVVKLAPAFVEVFNSIIKTVTEAIKVVVAVLTSLYKVFDGVIDFLMGVFTADWDKAWKGIEKIFTGIWEIISLNLKLALNGMISMINVFIKFWNSIKLEVPGVEIGGKMVGGFSIGVPQISEIPKLAQGGITNGPMLATIGDNKGGREVVSPLDDLMGMVVSAVSTTMQMMGGGQQSSGNNGDIVIMMDTTEVARIINPALQREQQRIGSSAIIRPI